MSSRVDGLLSQMLRGIFQGCPDLCEARRQAHTLHREVWMMERRGIAEHRKQENEIDGLEIVLACVLKVSGKNCKVEEAKHRMRTNFGDEGRVVASQISGLSKARNAKSHPKAYKIAAAIERLVAARSAENAMHEDEAGGAGDRHPVFEEREGCESHSRPATVEICGNRKKEDFEEKSESWQATVERMTKEHEEVRASLVRELEEKSIVYETQIQELRHQSEVPVQTEACANAEVQVNEALIRQATVYTMPDGELRNKFDNQVQAHQSRYPGGTLPSELRSFKNFKKDVLRMASIEQKIAMVRRSHFCGVEF